MEDLQNIWSTSKAAADNHFNSYEHKMKKEYALKAKDQFKNIQIHQLGFFIFSLILFLVFNYILVFHTGFFGIGNPERPIVFDFIGALFFFASYWYLSFKCFLKYRKDLAEVKTDSIKSSLNKYLTLTEKHRKVQINLNFKFIMLAYAIKLFTQLMAGEGWVATIIILGISLLYEKGVNEEIYDYFWKDSEVELKILLRQLEEA